MDSNTFSLDYFSCAYTQIYTYVNRLGTCMNKSFLPTSNYLSTQSITLNNLLKLSHFFYAAHQLWVLFTA